jgi:hypothetical protein
VGAVGIIYGVVHLVASSQAAVGVSLVDVAAVSAGAALVVGIFTPVAGGLVVLGALGILFPGFPSPAVDQFQILLTIFVGVVAAAVILLGPGALSLDARLFGRREIIIPRTSRSSES